MALVLLLAGCGGSTVDAPLQSGIANGCPAQTTEMIVAVVFGQSNSANHLERKYIASSDRVVNFFDGKCFRAEDPLRGATGDQGSVWTLMGERISRPIVLVSIGVGDTYIDRWANGDLNQLLKNTLSKVSASGYKVTHFLWHQGENDAGETSGADYASRLSRVIQTTRERFPESAFYVSVASFCKKGMGVDPAIQNAQLASVNPAARIYAGPNTDVLGLEYRYDGCHFSAGGQEIIAGQWAGFLH